jgi:hypothetical protein
MAVKTAEELVVKSSNGHASTSVAAAAKEAGNEFGTTDVDAQGKAIAEAWQSKLTEQTKALSKRLSQAAAPSNNAIEAGSPIGPGLYNWFDVLVVGPFQQTGPLGPFLPHKIISASEAAFLLVAVWRNPFPIPGGGSPPSAAQVMTGLSYRVNVETINLTAVIDGPDRQQTGVFGAGFIDVHVFNFPAGPSGRRRLASRACSK